VTLTNNETYPKYEDYISTCTGKNEDYISTCTGKYEDYISTCTGKYRDCIMYLAIVYVSF
jgi:hypothetical protein